MATQVEVPALGESVKTAVLVKWHKADGEAVKIDEPLCELETDKANVDVPAPAAGVVRRLKAEGDQVAVGEAIARIDAGTGAAAPAAAAAQVSGTGAGAVPPASAPPASPAAGATAGGYAPEDYSPAVRAMLEEHKLDPKSLRGTGPGGRLTKEDVQSHLDKGGNGSAARPQPAVEAPPPAMRPAAAAPPMPSKPKDVATTAKASAAATPAMQFDADGVHRAPMSKMRKAIARRLVEAQQSAAILTTFNEIDLTEIIALRAKYKDRFAEVHGIGLGFMSFFARAAVLALREFPRVNAFLEGDDIVYHNYVHLGIAVSTERGLAVPVLRDVQDMGFARIESEIKRVATAVRDGKLGLDELSGGTFTITNGGVFGSLLSTPILNPPQSGILGMHTIQKRPMVMPGDKVEVRSMMYVALSYDHRLVDGRESVSFLVRLKQYLEDPARLMLEI